MNKHRPYIFLTGAKFIAEGEETRKGNKKVFDHLLRDESHDLWKRSFHCSEPGPSKSWVAS